MARPKLRLPVIQNWSCHNCSGCCRQHLIEITEEEKTRIEKQNWTAEDGIPADRPVVVRHGRGWRLNHAADGGCIFLNDEGLCRIHAKFGEPAKPLACRVYPYALHPSGQEVTVSLRFSCPSVVENKGTPLADNAKEIGRIAKAVTEGKKLKTDSPEISPGQTVDWADLLQLTETLDRIFADPAVPFDVQLHRALFWANLIGEMTFESVRGVRLAELLGIIAEEAAIQISSSPEPEQPSRSGRMLFRMLVAQYARRDTASDLDAGWKGRFRLLRAAVKYARGRGTVPVLHEKFSGVPFDAMEQEFGPPPSDTDELFTRYFRVKIQGLHFCGSAYYHVPFVEGFHSLALMVPVVLWLARALAVGAGRSELIREDIVTALTVADHHHGYSPALGSRAARSRTRTLAKAGDIPRLISWYRR
ncbi:YkgJ family cysteine cluster protein [Thalassoroseus pseudoceratinae]|uniref:YkgJ family cysteine cluster protein n=1 Tax=Thalassoroseus pseudoceratinae TaxID=2713176 RepID=UPI0014240627|nr:YkgJ family cysteine cluster protein [Thalassoroseus pseudoceratinae]